MSHWSSTYADWYQTQVKRLSVKTVSAVSQVNRFLNGIQASLPQGVTSGAFGNGDSSNFALGFHDNGQGWDGTQRPKSRNKTAEGWNITAYGVFDSSGNRKSLEDMGVSQSDSLTWGNAWNAANYLFNPFQDMSECYNQGCGLGGWAMATAGIVPVVKWGRRGADLADSGNFLYRGIHKGHPEYNSALKGRAVPGNVRGSTTPKMHNLGRNLKDSPYTSWTDDLNIAKFHAGKEGSGGLIMRVSKGAPTKKENWRWEMSPDSYRENERLLRGVRNNAEVFEL